MAKVVMRSSAPKGGCHHFQPHGWHGTQTTPTATRLCEAPPWYNSTLLTAGLTGIDKLMHVIDAAEQEQHEVSLSWASFTYLLMDFS